MVAANSLVPEWTDVQHRQAAVCLATTLRTIVGHDPRLLPLVQLHADVAWKKALGREASEYLMDLVATQPDSKPLSPPEGPDAHEEGENRLQQRQ